ncbi:MAG: CoB--CoM heterodisulfide reductase iron-sulfur subunit A family protein [Methanomassiliicoccales archaeon]|nr:CoB--CoM heterodisulfide reductase iron-sulfur subunit A family protein [Methanomassiliicoccales archaeon]
MADVIGAVMVVGAGISGVQTSLDLADSGFKVYLVEKKPSIGGAMAQLDKTFPTNDCSMCIMAPKLVEAGRHRNIKLITNAEVESIDGKPGNFMVKLKKNTLRVDDKKCTGCGECAIKCPVETKDEYNEGLAKRKAIFVMYPQAVPLVYSIDKNICIGCGICYEECKAKAVVYDKKDESMDIQVGAVVLCPGFDEFNAKLKREYGYGEFKNVVTSIEFERILSSTGPYFGTVLRPSDGEVPQKVAFIQCVGSRDEKVGNTYCSSVCCMYSIKEAIIAGEHTAGLKPTIFFMDVRAVGKEFEDYVKRAEGEYGIKMHRGTRIASVDEVEGNNLLLRYSEGGNVKAEEFDMVVLAVGLKPPQDAGKLAERLGIKLNKHGFCDTSIYDPLSTSRPGIFVSGAFAAPKDIPTSVAEASGVASKAGTIIATARNTLVTKEDYPKELEVLGQEPRIGVFVCHCGINIGGIVDVPSVVEYVKTLPNVVYSEDNKYTCSADTQERIKKMIKEHNLNRVVVASCTPRTHEPLFQNTIREAGLNPFLFELANIRDQCSWIHMHEPEKATVKAKDLTRMAVAKSRFLEPLTKAQLNVNHTATVIGGGLAGMTAALDIALQGFKVDLLEVTGAMGGQMNNLYTDEGGKSPRQFIKDLEAKVRANDKITVHMNTKVEDVSGFVGNFKVKVTGGKEIETGVIVVATGAKPYEPKEYMYGKAKGVVTQNELEKALVEGHVHAKTVVMIQCVGSRNDEAPYCSRVCCAKAVKNAIEIKKKDPKTQVYILHKDIRTYGFRETLYKEAGELGVKFIRFPENKMPEMTMDGSAMKVLVDDTVLNAPVQLSPDLLVLSVGIRPNEDNEELAKMCKVPLSKDKYFLEAHMKLRPVDFATSGIYLAGLAHWPKFIDETIGQASGAAARAMTIISKQYLETQGIIAAVNEMVCNGCGICEPVCEYKAITIVGDPANAEKRKAVINEGLCMGCGTCVAACPSGALEQKGFKNNQILAQIDAALLVGGGK